MEQKMAYQEEFYELNIVKLRRIFPMLHLWRIPGIAFEWRKILIGLLFIYFTMFLESFFRNLSTSWMVSIHFYSRENWLETDSYLINTFLQLVQNIYGFWKASLTGMFYMKLSALNVTQYGIFLAGMVTAGALLSRLAAIEFTAGRPGTLRQGVRYLREQGVSLLMLLLTYLFFLAGFMVMKYILSSMLNNYTFYVLCPLMLLVGFLGLIYVWMCCAHSIVISANSVDGCDSFDAFGRGYSYSVNWLGYCLLLILMGTLISAVALWIFSVVVAVLILVIDFFTHGATFNLATYASILQSVTENLILSSPRFVENLDYKPMSFDNYKYFYQLLSMLVPAAGLSLFWSGSTVIYFLLRHAEDGTSLNTMYTASAESPTSGVPLVGMAEREQAMKKEEQKNNPVAG